eukprot:SAG31_NODE_34010_length_337_cov_1.298319_1_plen_28_part_01
MSKASLKTVDVKNGMCYVSTGRHRHVLH